MAYKNKSSLMAYLIPAFIIAGVCFVVFVALAVTGALE